MGRVVVVGLGVGLARAGARGAALRLPQVAPVARDGRGVDVGDPLGRGFAPLIDRDAERDRDGPRVMIAGYPYLQEQA